MILRSDRVTPGSRSPSISPRAAISPRCRGGSNNYLVDGVGLFDVNTNLDMTQRPGRLRPHAAGSPRARRRIDNETMRDLLGGVGHDHRRRRDGAVRPDPGQQHPRRRARRCACTSGGGIYRPQRRARPPPRRRQPAPTARSRSTSPARRARRASRSPRQARASASARNVTRRRSARRAQGWALEATGESRLRAVLRRRRHPLQPRAADHRGQPADLRRGRLRRPARADRAPARSPAR